MNNNYTYSYIIKQIIISIIINYIIDRNINNLNIIYVVNVNKTGHLTNGLHIPKT